MAADFEQLERLIEVAKPHAEKYRDALTVALANTPGQEWRSVELQLGFLTAEFVTAMIEAAKLGLLDDPEGLERVREEA